MKKQYIETEAAAISQAELMCKQYRVDVYIIEFRNPTIAPRFRLYKGNSNRAFSDCEVGEGIKLYGTVFRTVGFVKAKSLAESLNDEPGPAVDTSEDYARIHE